MMSGYIEPQMWVDLDLVTKERMVKSLCDVGLLRGESELKSMALLENMARQDKGSLVFIHTKHILMNRGVEKILKEVKTRQQAHMVEKHLGIRVDPAVYRDKSSDNDNPKLTP